MSTARYEHISCSISRTCPVPVPPGASNELVRSPFPWRSPWRFQGRILESADGSTDLYDFQARSYDPSLGAFTSFDSVTGSAQNPLTLNRFLYAAANPATLVDPDGHAAGMYGGAYASTSEKIRSYGGPGGESTWGCGGDCSTKHILEVSERKHRANQAARESQTRLDRILVDYQVTEVDMIPNYVPTAIGQGIRESLVSSDYWAGPLAPLAPKHPLKVKSLGAMTSTEAKMYDDLIQSDPLKAYLLMTIEEDATNTAKTDKAYAGEARDDSHLDAFRHIYATARMTQLMGSDWAASWGIAHEQVPGNSARREAMDLYNDGVGIRVALAHPGATPDELKDYVRSAVSSGQAVVIQGADKASHLAWSSGPTGAGSTGLDCDTGQGCDIHVSNSISPTKLISGEP
jgi:RHS repeat-associated protein